MISHQHPGTWSDEEMIVAVSAARDYLEFPTVFALKDAGEKGSCGNFHSGTIAAVKIALFKAHFNRKNSQIYSFFRDRILCRNTVKSLKIDALLHRLFPNEKEMTTKTVQMPLNFANVAEIQPAKPAETKPAEQLLTELPVESLKTIVNSINEVFGNITPKFDFKGSLKPVEQNTSEDGVASLESRIKDAQHNLLESAVLLHELVIQMLKVVKEKVGVLEKENEQRRKYMEDFLSMKPSEFCSRYHLQNCSVCEYAECHDNTNPIAKLQNENERLTKENVRLETERAEAIRKLNRIKSQVNEAVQ